MGKGVWRLSMTIRSRGRRASTGRFTGGPPFSLQPGAGEVGEGILDLLLRFVAKAARVGGDVQSPVDPRRVGQGEASFHSKRVWRVGGFRKRSGRDACNARGVSRRATISARERLARCGARPLGPRPDRPGPGRRPSYDRVNQGLGNLVRGIEFSDFGGYRVVRGPAPMKGSPLPYSVRMIGASSSGQAGSHTAMENDNR